MKTIKDNIVTIFEQLTKYEAICQDFKKNHPGSGAISIADVGIKTHSKNILCAMKGIKNELIAEKAPMNGLGCFVNLDKGLGSGRAKGSNSFYLTWEGVSPTVDGVALSCYIAMNFILCGDRTHAPKIDIGCGFWVKVPENGEYSTRVKEECKNQFAKFRRMFGYPTNDNGKFVRNDCDLDNELVSLKAIDVPKQGDKFVFNDDGVKEISDALKSARDNWEVVRKWADEFSRKDILELLENNYQIILTGAPGTGKTYLAEKLIAPSFVKMADRDDNPFERIFKVQFHPGYDYSDFVIGLKPVLVDDEGKECDAPQDGKKVSVTFRWKEGLFLSIARLAKAEYDDAKRNSRTPKKYVLIIDEINRADLSRVFGELFSQLESGYRYRLTKTPGAELEKEIREQDNKGILLPNNSRLVVPENLYIIGTMNDIDRSVESIDFAMRRRFGWHEVSAVDSQSILAMADGSNSPLIDAMAKLNEMIDGVKGLGKDYHLGGAIFAKVAQYAAERSDQERYELLWKNHIANTLKDYLRGNPKAKETYEKLEEAYKAAASKPRKQKDEIEEDVKPEDDQPGKDGNIENGSEARDEATDAKRVEETAADE